MSTSEPIFELQVLASGKDNNIEQTLWGLEWGVWRSLVWWVKVGWFHIEQIWCSGRWFAIWLSKSIGFSSIVLRHNYFDEMLELDPLQEIGREGVQTWEDKIKHRVLDILGDQV